MIANFETTGSANLASARAHAAKLNIKLEPGVGFISTLAKNWNPKQETPVKYLSRAIRTANELESPAFRVYLGNPADRAAGTMPETFIDEALQSRKAVRSQALDAQVKIATENHGEFHSRHITAIIEQAGTALVSTRITP